MIGTREHRDEVADRLYRRGVDVGEAIQDGFYIELDATETFSELLLNDAPDARRFMNLVGGHVMEIRKTADNDRPVVICDEMAALLWQEGKESAAICLEQLWNDLADTHSISLCCAYSMESFPGNEDGKPFHQICANHTAVVPCEDYSRLWSDDERLRNVACLQQKSQALETEERLRHGERRFRELMEAVREYAIYTLDAHGYVVTWNAGAERILGYEKPEILGHHFSAFFSQEDVLAGKPMLEMQIASSEGRFEEDGWRVRKDGWKFFANVVLTAVREDAGAVIGYAAITRDITEQILGKDSLGDAHESILESEHSLRQYSLLVMRRQEEERKRIGEDLLDSLGQYLTVIKMKLDSAPPFAENRESKSDVEFAQCLNLVEESIKEVRAVSYLLYPPLLEEVGLRSAIPWYLDGFMKRSGIKTRFEISPGFRRLSNDASVAIYRVLQEALTNVQRHSGSSTADIQLLTKNDCVILIVSDAGRGMPSDLLGPSHRRTSPLGMGLRGMSERICCLGGRLEITSSGEGATITATIPVSSCVMAAMSA